MKSNWLWDTKTSVNEVKKILRNPENKKFLKFAALLLSRENSPKEVFSKYLKPIAFCRNWRLIKKVMRKDNWNDTRIEFWQAIYEVLRERFRKKGVDFKEGTTSLPKKENEFCKTIAEKIKLIRKQKGLTQVGLAKKLGVSQQMVSRIEKGKENISLLTLKSITEALGAEVNVEIL